MAASSEIKRLERRANMVFVAYCVLCVAAAGTICWVIYMDRLEALQLKAATKPLRTPVPEHAKIEAADVVCVSGVVRVLAPDSEAVGKTPEDYPLLRFERPVKK